MRYMKKWKKRLCAVVCLIAVSIGALSPLGDGKAEAAAADRADIRFVFTTDLHGRLTTKDYELNKSFQTGSVAKAYTLIQGARAEKPDGNTFTFDLGDVLYDYTTETIYGMEPETVQPIYKAMAKMGYDAVVLGNHEFDYGFDYIMQQMTDSGLRDICVVSNLKYSKSKSHVFEENMILSRKVTTQNGKQVTVKIGVIGETVPVLSKKRENYIGTLIAEDIVDNTTEQAKKLKSQGADVVVVLAHSGFGAENPAEFSKDASYALTKIPEVDVVLGGHAHTQFPSQSSAVSSYYNYNGVDKNTGLVNGKNLVMANDKGQSIGVADITLEMEGKNKKIVKRSSAVRNVKSTTPASSMVEQAFGKWKEYFEEVSANTVGTLEGGQKLENYFGLVEDSSVMQLLNNAKISYGIKTLADNANFQNHPIVAVSNYVRYGQLSADDFVSLTGNLTEGNLSALAAFNKYVFLYEVSGYQIKEWMEWSASAYETTSKTKTWSDETMNRLMKEKGLKSLVSEEWLDEWSSFYVFDGISYSIDPSVEPRYDFYGKKINSTNRIKNITYNGVPVTDTMKFVLASEPLTGSKIGALQGIENNFITKGITTNIKVLMDYVKQLGAMGPIKAEKDNNWSLKLPASYQYIVKASRDAVINKSVNKWYQGDAGTSDQYSYYIGKGTEGAADTDGPNVVVASTNGRVTNKNIRISVRATDMSTIKKLTYLPGKYEKEFFRYGVAETIKDNSFTVIENGIYTVYAEDEWGNGTIEYVNVDNISTSVLQIPVIKSYTNRMSTIQGTAEPNATIYFITDDGKEYESTVKENGTFSFSLPSQDAGKQVVTYVKDSSGRVSSKVVLDVKRTGANQPYAEKVSNVQSAVRGKTNDRNTGVIMTAGDIVYVPRGGTEDYKISDKFDEKKTIVETDINVESSGNYTIKVPPLTNGTVVWVFGMDSANRGSKGYKRIVEYAGPNAPVLYPVCDMETSVKGRVPFMKKDKVTEVVVSVGGMNYDVEPDTAGYFSLDEVVLSPQLPISVYAKGIGAEEGTTASSAVIYDTVKNTEDFAETEFDPFLSIEQLDNKSTQISGHYDGEAEAQLILSVGGVISQITTEDNGNFTIPLPERLNAGTKVTALARMEYGEIFETSVQSVKVGKPDKPEVLTEEIDNITEEIQIATTEKGRVEIHLGKKKFISKESVFDNMTKRYVFTVKITKCEPKDKLKVYSFNSAGSSDAVEIIVKENPDAKDLKDKKDTKTDAKEKPKTTS